jgi:uncharacterized LabA/DUF88 family protein
MKLLDKILHRKDISSSAEKSTDGIIETLPLEKSIAFVDYEYWFYSYKTQFGMVPEPKKWRDSIEPYNVQDVLIFGEFSRNNAIKQELSRLRDITNTIIETFQPTGRTTKKDVTDFVMLDYLYQTAFSQPDITTFLIFTGDGHFCSVVKYLSQTLRKKVIVYGVTGTISNRLREVATQTIELPDDHTTYEQYKKMIVNNMSYVSDHPQIVPTFNGTVNAIAKTNPGVSEELLRRSLDQMLSDGLLKKEQERIAFNQRVFTIRPDWQKLHEAGLWEYK